MREKIKDEDLLRYAQGEMDWRDAVKVRAAVQENSELQERVDSFSRTSALINAGMDSLMTERKAVESKTTPSKTKPIITLWTWAPAGIAACLLLMFGLRFMHPSSRLNWPEQKAYKTANIASELKDRLDPLIRTKLDQELKQISWTDWKKRREACRDIYAKPMRVRDISILSQKNIVLEMHNSETGEWFVIAEFQPDEVNLETLAGRAAEALLKE